MLSFLCTVKEVAHLTERVKQDTNVQLDMNPEELMVSSLTMSLWHSRYEPVVGGKGEGVSKDTMAEELAWAVSSKLSAATDIFYRAAWPLACRCGDRYS